MIFLSGLCFLQKCGDPVFVDKLLVVSVMVLVDEIADVALRQAQICGDFFEGQVWGEVESLFLHGFFQIPELLLVIVVREPGIAFSLLNGSNKRGVFQEIEERKAEKQGDQNELYQIELLPANEGEEQPHQGDE